MPAPRTQYRSIPHYCGIALILDILCISWLIHETLVYEGHDVAQVAVLIGGPVSIATLLVGVISGIALGRHIANSERREVLDEGTPLQ